MALPPLLIFQDSTPKFEAMSIEKSKFIVCSQYNFACVSQSLLGEVLFFVYCSVNFEVALPLFWVSKRPGSLTSDPRKLKKPLSTNKVPRGSLYYSLFSSTSSTISSTLSASSSELV